MALSKSTKAAIKGWLKKLRLRYRQWRYAFSPEDLARALRDVGVQAGDHLLVHSGFDKFFGFQGKATDVIATLQQAVGEQGHLIMPTMTFTGSAIQYAQQGEVFDPKRTPSRMGLITELFRRSRGVVRSIHPTHSMAIWGPDAANLAEGHHLATTPCGLGSPLASLLDRQGKILFIGASIESMTFFHTVEELLEADMPFSPFTAECYTLQSLTSDGDVVQTKTRLFAPEYSRIRRIARIEPELKRRRAWHRKRVGGLDILLLQTGDILRVTRELADRSVYCYEI